MEKVLLTQGKYALVDDEDFDKIKSIKWYFDHGYAANKSWKIKKIYMHRFILGINKKMIDHINRNGLDNRKENLRICTPSQNLANQKLNIKNTSGYKGVSWNKTLKYWVAIIKVNQKQHVKYFKNKEDAAKEYNKMAIKYFGEFALLNNIK